MRMSVAEEVEFKLLLGERLQTNLRVNLTAFVQTCC